MMLRKNEKIGGVNAYFLLIGIVGLFFCLFPVQENTESDARVFAVENVLQDNTAEDPGVSYFLLQNKPSKRFFKYIAHYCTSFIKLKSNTNQAVIARALVWQKPTYYQFLFRYTLF